MKQDERDDLLQTLANGQVTMQQSQAEAKLVIAKIHRGLYGEPENNVIGLIEDQKNDEKKFKELGTKVDNFSKRIEANTKFRNAATKVGKNTLKTLGVGAIPSIGGVVAYFKEIKQFLITLFHL